MVNQTESEAIGGAVGSSIAAYTKAQAAVTIALISLLTQRGILTASDVQSDILDSLQNIVEDIRKSASPEKPLNDVTERETVALSVLLDHYRDRLFSKN